MTREIDPERPNRYRLLRSSPSAYQGFPEDPLTTADGGAMPNDPNAGEALLIENERYWQRR